MDKQTGRPLEGVPPDRYTGQELAASPSSESYELYTDARHGQGVQSGMGNVQVNIYGGGHAGGPRPVKLPPKRPVTALGPFDLDIHRVLAIETGKRLPSLPRYVERRHDAQIRSYLSGTASCMVVVTGCSSTGKSRALYEALLRHDQIRAWPLIAPTSPGQLLDLLDAGHIGSHTVLWLNDLEQYLLFPSGERVAEAVAEALRDLLRDPAAEPVAVVATLWPSHPG